MDWILQGGGGGGGVNATAADSHVLISGLEPARQTSKHSSGSAFQRLICCICEGKSSWFASVSSLKGKLQSAAKHKRHNRDNREDGDTDGHTTPPRTKHRSTGNRPDVGLTSTAQRPERRELNQDLKQANWRAAWRPLEAQETQAGVTPLNLVRKIRD